LPNWVKNKIKQSGRINFSFHFKFYIWKTML